MNEFSSAVTFRSLTEETIVIDDVRVDTILLNHPGRCLGFRITYKDKVFCYITDNEIYLKEDKQRYNKEEVDRLTRFVKHSDLLIIDATYMDEEYKHKIGWGHSSLTSVVELAANAEVKVLCLHHHDPDQSDCDIDKKLELAQAVLQELDSDTKCIIPHEGDEIVI